MRTTASIFFLLCFLDAAILSSLVVGGVRMRLVKAYSGQFCGCKNVSHYPIIPPSLLLFFVTVQPICAPILFLS